MPCELTVCIAREKSPVCDKNILRAFICQKIYASAHSIFRCEPKQKGICANSPQGIYFREIKAIAIPTIDFLMKQLVFEHIHSQGIYSSENSVSVIEKLFDLLLPVIVLM